MMKNLIFLALFIFVLFKEVCSLRQQHENIKGYQSKHPLIVSDDSKICDGNRFEYISLTVLGRQNDLTKTFAQIQKNIAIKNVTYSDRIARTYKIYNFKQKIMYLETKQKPPEVRGINILNITGGTVRITYEFQWEKQQMGSSIKGNGSGLALSDVVTFEKTLETNQTHELQWFLTKTQPVGISNSLTLSKVSPYTQNDYTILNLMLNNLKDNATTVKIELIKALNTNYSKILGQIVKHDQTLIIPKQIYYNYVDYRGEFQVTYTNVLLSNWLTKDGLSLLLSTVISIDKNFECGQKVPDQPQDESKYGGVQQFISNKFFKSTLKFALEQHSIDVSLSQQNWQSRAFQFYMGDLHDTIASTKSLSSFIQLNGTCRAMDDKSFNLDTKDINTYRVNVNYTCTLLQSSSKIADIVLPIEYDIQPKITNKQLNFVVTDIKGTPTYKETAKFKITNYELANFMLTQSLNIAKNSKVIGSGYKTKSRKDPHLQVREGYLFLYDRASINKDRKTVSNKKQQKKND